MTVTAITPLRGIENYEMALLGAAMTGADITDIATTIKSDDFKQPHHEDIWKAIVAVDNTGLTVDAYTVMSKLGKAAHTLPNGATYLADCLAACTNPTQAGWLAEQVAEGAAQRRIDSIAVRLRQLGEQDMTAAEKREMAKTWLDELGEERTTTYSSPGDALPEVIDIAQNGQAGAMPTRWEDLNRVLQGWYPNQLITVAARPGVGKSIFGENTATDAAMQGKPVFVASLEMSSVELTQRTVSQLANVNLQALRTGHLSEDDWRKVRKAANTVADLPIRICDTHSQTVATIRAGAKQLQRTRGLGMVVVDYLGLVNPPDRRIPRHQQIGEMTRGFKSVAKELGVPVMQLAQLRRSENPKALPTMSDLKESGNIEEDSDVVLLLHWHRDDPSVIKVIVEKQRSGPSGVVIDLERWGHYAELR